MTILEDVTRALAEDMGTGDITAELLPNDQILEAVILSREPMFICGQAWVDAVFAQLDHRIQCQWLVAEGSWLAEPMHVCQISGPARAILTGERTALNFLQTLSGTATQTYAFVQALHGTQTRLLDTRKTIPGLRLAQKYAVQSAGATNHRIDRKSVV